MSEYKILLPLEANNNNEGLIRSAITLGSTLSARLTFLYIINTSQYTGYAGSGTAMAVSSMASINEQKDAIKDHFINMMEKLKSEIPSSMSIERNTSEGPWVSSIIEYIDKYNPDMLMLKHEEHGFLEKILGDSNTEILTHVKIPGWIIPEKKTLKIPRKAAYLTDHRAGDLEALKQLSKIFSSFGAEVSLVHMVDPENFDSVLKREGFISLLGKELPDLKCTHRDIAPQKMTEEVNRLIKSEEFELLSMRNESENFLNRFFTRSSVEKLIDSVDIPLAIYS